jgi:hypothetical protein
VRRRLSVVLILLALGLGLLPEATPANAAAPAARQTWKRLSSGAATFEVPASWLVHDLAAEQRHCVRFDLHAVYLGTEGANAECPSRAIGTPIAGEAGAGQRAAARPGASRGTGHGSAGRDESGGPSASSRKHGAGVVGLRPVSGGSPAA